MSVNCPYFLNNLAVSERNQRKKLMQEIFEWQLESLITKVRKLYFGFWGELLRGEKLLSQWAEADAQCF